MDNASRSLKILLLGDTSNFHNTLAKGLRRLGHDVTVASDGTGWMNTPRDIDLSRGHGKAGGLWLWLKMRFLMRQRLSGYDVVAISGTHFARLKPSRLRSIFDMVRRNNRRVFQTALATDTFFVEECLDPLSPLSYNEWRVGNNDTPYSLEKRQLAVNWTNGALSDYCHHLAMNIDGAVTVLYEYHVSCHRALPDSKIKYGGIPIDTREIHFIPVDETPRQVRLFIGYPSHRMLEKGAERLLAAARRVAREYPDRCTLDVASDIPLDEFMKRLEASHVVIDQLYSYTPATTALMAMAMGKTVLSGGEEDFYSFIGEKELRPVVNLDPRDDESIYLAIRDVVLHPELLAARGLMGREFVKRHNSTEVVARRFLDAWLSRD